MSDTPPTIEPPVPGMTVKPELLDDPRSYEAWCMFVEVATFSPRFHAEYLAETGVDLKAFAGCDETTANEVGARFADWLTERHWNAEGDADA